MLIFFLLFLVSAHQAKSLELFNDYPIVYKTKIKFEANQQISDFLTEECKCPVEINNNFFENTYPHQWKTIQALETERKNNLLKKILHRTNDISYKQLRSGIACLIAAGACVDQTDKFQCSNALEKAATYQDYYMAKFLLENRANPNHRLKSKFHIFFWLESVKMAILFAEYNAQFYFKNELGSSILHLVASRSGYEPDLITFYTQHKVNINEKDSFGNTALHDLIIFSSDRYEILEQKTKLLLDAGISLNVPNNNNYTIQDLLDTAKEEKIIRLRSFIYSYNKN